MHLMEERHEHRRLARACGTDDEVEHAVLELNILVDAEAEGLLRGRQRAVVDLIRPGEVCTPKADIAYVLRGGVHDYVFRRRLSECVQKLSLDPRQRSGGNTLESCLTLRKKSATRPRETLAR